MSIVLHPLTALDGLPAYTADDYRHVVNPFLLPSDGAAFNCVSGVRAGAPNPLCSIDGLTVQVSPHCGVFSPWSNVGAYTYAITEIETVTVPDSAGSYKIAVTVEDPSQSHGDVPKGSLEVFGASVADSAIAGLVIAKVDAGVISDVAPRLRAGTVVEVTAWDQLESVAAADGVEAVNTRTGERYRRISGVWESISDIKLSPGQWAKDWTVKYKCALSGNVASISVTATRGPKWDSTAWDRSQILTFPEWIKPKYDDINVPAAGAEHSVFQLDPTGLYIRPTANVTYNTGSWVSGSFAWPIK